MSEHTQTETETGRQQEQEHEATLKAWALECLDAADNDINDATVSLAERVDGDRALMETLRWIGAEQIVRLTRMQVRENLKRTGGAPSESTAERFRRGQAKGTESFERAMRGRMVWDYPLPVSGKRIAEATMNDMRECVAYRAKRVETETRRLENARKVLELLEQSGATTVQEGISFEVMREIILGGGV